MYFACVLHDFSMPKFCTYFQYCQANRTNSPSRCSNILYDIKSNLPEDLMTASAPSDVNYDLVMNTDNSVYFRLLIIN